MTGKMNYGRVGRENAAARRQRQREAEADDTRAFRVRGDKPLECSRCHAALTKGEYAVMKVDDGEKRYFHRDRAQCLEYQRARRRALHQG